MNEIETVETAVKKDVAAIVTDVVHDGDYVISVVNQEAEPAIKAEVTKAEVAVAKVEKRARIAIDLADRAAIREIENAYLRASQDLVRVQQVVQFYKTKYEAQVASFVKKYGVNPAEHAWSELEACFESLETRFRKL